jgi:hypothetical protein
MSLVVPPFGSGQVGRLLLATFSQFRRLFGAGVILLALSATVQAQDQSYQANAITHSAPAAVVPADRDYHIYYPGSVWSSTANNPQPSEKDLVSYNHVEQGVAYRGAELFGSVTGVLDTQSFNVANLRTQGIGNGFGFDWNRRLIEGVGVRFTQNLPHGIVRAGVQYLRENRYVGTRRTYTGVSPFVEAWFGWGQNGK